MTVATFSQPNFNTDDPTTYRGKLDANSSVSTTIVDNFAPHAVASPNMTVQLDAGAIPGVGAMPVQVALQTSATLTAPAANPRKDIVYIDSLTGVIGVATGAEAVSPVDPAVPALKIAIARVSMTVGMTTITNSIITDLRAPMMAFAGSATFTALSANTTLTIGQSSGRFKLTGTVTVTLPTPIGNSNLSFALWGGDGNTQTISPAASSYKMPDGTTPTSYTVTANQGIEVVSDGSVYQVIRLFGKDVTQTPNTTDNSTKVATTAMVQAAITAATDAQIQPVAASVASNALTLTLNPTVLGFRSTPVTSGTVNKRIVSTAVSVVVSNGSTLGTVNATSARLVIIAIDATSLGGAVELAVVNLTGGVNLDETTLISTTAEGGAGLADSASVIYSTTARSNVPFRVVGFIDITEATAGVWATAPTTVQGSGGRALQAIVVPPVSKILQVVHYDNGASATGTTQITFDDTIPQNNEGDQFMSLAITPLSATSTLVIDVTYFASNGSSDWTTGALFRDSTASAIGAMSSYYDTGGTGHPTTFSVKAPSNATTATTFTVRIGGSTGGTITFNGQGGTRKLGGVMSSSIRITEIAP
jgi:hypothetical protein